MASCRSKQVTSTHQSTAARQAAGALPPGLTSCVAPRLAAMTAPPTGTMKFLSVLCTTASTRPLRHAEHTCRQASRQQPRQVLLIEYWARQKGRGEAGRQAGRHDAYLGAQYCRLHTVGVVDDVCDPGLLAQLGHCRPDQGGAAAAGWRGGGLVARIRAERGTPVQVLLSGCGSPLSSTTRQGGNEQRLRVEQATRTCHNVVRRPWCKAAGGGEDAGNGLRTQACHLLL